jgi:hypothetical protein
MKNRTEITMESITLNQLARLFGKGKFATVTFVKKGNGQIRVLNGKTNVQSALVGGQPTYNANERNQLRVCDVNVRVNGVRTPSYRTVTVDNVIDVRANCRIYKITKPNVQKNFINSIELVGNDLMVTMNGSNRYQYKNVSKELVQGFQTAESKGVYFNKHIKGLYETVKLV